MCRWLAYTGDPVLLDELYKPKNSLIGQSLHSRLGAETTNGDGFGVGWYRTHTRAVDAQRARPGLRDGEARPRAGGRPGPVPQIEGSTDSELLFFLALTLGLEDDPPRAVERTVGPVESTGRRHAAPHHRSRHSARTSGVTIPLDGVAIREK
jgi:predicted glutamine amidotransferase